MQVGLVLSSDEDVLSTKREVIPKRFHTVLSQSPRARGFALYSMSIVLV